MTITLTAREREVFASMIDYVRKRCANQHGINLSGNAIARWMEDWLASQPAETSASPSRVPVSSIDNAQQRGHLRKCAECQGAGEIAVWGASIQSWTCPNCEGTGSVPVVAESGPSQPMTDICERLDAEAMRLEHKGRLVDEFPSAIMREAAAEIRRLRADLVDIRAAGKEAWAGGRDEGFRAGIEAAAKWHDGEAFAHYTQRDVDKADLHTAYAAAIRALADAPKSAVKMFEGFEPEARQHPCPSCRGAGRNGPLACNHCGATGVDPAHRAFKREG